MTKTADTSDIPGVLVFPPVIFLVSIVGGLLVHWFVPWHIPLGGPARIVVAVVLIGASGAVARWAARTMRQAGTNVNPGRPTTAIVTEGPFRYTRNPLYLSVMALGIGVAVAIGSLWPIAFLIATFPVLEFGVVRREERYLEAKFGEPYREYTRRVRRWI